MPTLVEVSTGVYRLSFTDNEMSVMNEYVTEFNAGRIDSPIHRQDNTTLIQVLRRSVFGSLEMLTLNVRERRRARWVNRVEAANAAVLAEVDALLPPEPTS